MRQTNRIKAFTMILPALTALCFTACGERRVVAAASPRSDANAVAAPAKLRDFKAFQENGAPELWRQITDRPFSREPRLKLARLYRERGYEAVAHFVDTSVAAIGTDEVASNISQPAHHQWACDPATPDAQALVDRAHEKLLSGDPGGAYDQISSAIRSSPSPPCAITTEWSYVTLFRDAAIPGRSQVEEWEVAFRTAVTAGEELHDIGSNIDGVYELLSAHFRAAGDLPSAYAAATAALLRTAEHEKFRREQRAELVDSTRAQLAAARNAAPRN